MAGFTIKGRLDGLADLLQRMKQLRSGSNRGRMLKKALRKGNRVILKLMKAKCPVDTSPVLTVHGLMKKSIGAKIKANMNRGTAYAVSGPRKGFKTQVGTRKDGRPIYEDPALIGHLVEFGHGGPHPAPPHPFARPSFDEGKAAALAAIRASLEADLAKAAAKGLVTDDGGGAE